MGKIIVKKNEKKIIPFIWVNGNEKEATIDVEVNGDGGSVIVAGLFFGSQSQSIVFNTNVIHKGKNTKSLTTLRGVFMDTAKFSNDGMIHIAKGAKNADGYFSSKVLLFDDAKGRSVPSLEIDENELKAGHASTIGRPDEEQLFYLRSRGLSEKEAEKLIITGFFDPLLNYFSPALQKEAKKQLQKVL